LICSGPAVRAQDEARLDLPPGDSPPPTVFSRLEQAGDSKLYPDYGHIVVLDETINHVDELGVSSIDRYMLSKVLTAEGCRDLSVLRLGYEPQSSWVDLREVNLIREGKRIPVAVDALLDLPAPQSWIYWSDRIKLFQLPRLKVGDGIEVRTFRKGYSYALLRQAQPNGEPEDERFIPPMPGEYFDIVLFQGEVPIKERRYELHLPADKKLHSRVYNGTLYSSTSYDADIHVHAWWAFDLPAAQHEPHAPDASDYVTKVVMATVESWEAKSRWFFDVNDGQFESSPEIDQKVRQILVDAGVAHGSDDEKAKVLLHWVAQNIRYSGQTMGKGEGFTLHPGTMIFEQRSGVCKDIAGMLITMLRAAGLPTYAAMTMAGSRIEDVPADQFNHCVVARKSGDDWVMYDPTWVPYNNDIWSKLETEQHYLIGSPEGETLSRIPYSPPAESPLKVRHDARLARDGTLEGTLRLEGSGALDGRLRRLLTGTPRRRLAERFAALLSPISRGVEGVRVTHHPVDDFSGDVWIEVRYRAPGFALAVDDGLEFTDPAMSVLLHEDYLFRAAAHDWSEEREADVFLYHTQLLDVEERIRLPGGFAATLLPEKEEVDETYVQFAGDVLAEGGELSVRVTAEVRRRQIPPEGYESFREAIRRARDWSGSRLRVEPEGKKNSKAQGLDEKKEAAR
jgi:transglutaminase-like putative cysteine protease